MGLFQNEVTGDGGGRDLLKILQKVTNGGEGGGRKSINIEAIIQYSDVTDSFFNTNDVFSFFIFSNHISSCLHITFFIF